MNKLTDEEIEEQLRTEVCEAAPDILDELLEETGQVQKPKQVRVNKWLGYAAAFAAALLVFLGAGSFFSGAPEVKKDPVAMVGLDVNPSVELYIDDTDHVVSCRAVNEDGRSIIGDMDMTGSDIKVAANALIGSMLTHGYLTEKTNSIFVSVVADDRENGRKLENDIAGELNEYLDQAAVSAAVMGQYIKSDESINKFAEENQISTGKAWIIKTLSSSSKRMTEESLLKLSTQDLLLLWSERKSAQDDDTLRYGEINTEGLVSRDDACKAALERAGLSSDSVSRLDDRDDDHDDHDDDDDDDDDDD